MNSNGFPHMFGTSTPRPPRCTPKSDPEGRTASTQVVLAGMKVVEQRRKWHFDTHDNPWEFPPAAVVVKGQESVRKYYETWEQCDFSLAEVHALKLVFVGSYGAGKTRWEPTNAYLYTYRVNGIGTGLLSKFGGVSHSCVPIGSSPAPPTTKTRLPAPVLCGVEISSRHQNPHC